MNDVIAKNQAERASEQSVNISVRTGYGEERIFALGHGEMVTTILDTISVERGCPVEELELLREGEAEPLTAITTIHADYPSKRRHHVHHIAEVMVAVYYQSHEEKRNFKRSATLEEVLAWAIAVFKIDPTMATEFEFTRHGQKDELSGVEHVGHLAGLDCNLSLDLVRGDIANGASV
jgi:hypothetical protein